MKTPALLVAAILCASGCATTYSDADLINFDDQSLLAAATLKVNGPYYGDPRSETAKRAIAIYCDRYRWGEKIKDDILAARYWRGMSASMAVMSQGKATVINTTSGEWGTREQWVYEHPIGGGRLYLYFHGDRLESWQTSGI
jgi:hypothetical protein